MTSSRVAELSGKTAIVTGASSGIGRATARVLAEHGMRLALAARSTTALERLASELGDDALAVATDVTEQADVERLVARTLERFGQIDVLFANAGLYLAGPVADGAPEAFADLIDTNVTAMMRCVHAVLPSMLERGTGDVLVTSSISGHEAIHWEPVYSASKHAVQSFVHGLRRQVCDRGVRVGAIAPGVVLNELWGVTDPERIEQGVAERTGLRSEDVAEIVAFMLSRPRHVTIRDLVVLPQNQDI